MQISKPSRFQHFGSIQCASPNCVTLPLRASAVRRLNAEDPSFSHIPTQNMLAEFNTLVEEALGHGAIDEPAMLLLLTFLRKHVFVGELRTLADKLLKLEAYEEVEAQNEEKEKQKEENVLFEKKEQKKQELLRDAPGQVRDKYLSFKVYLIPPTLPRAALNSMSSS